MRIFASQEVIKLLRLGLKAVIVLSVLALQLSSSAVAYEAMSWHQQQGSTYSHANNADCNEHTHISQKHISSHTNADKSQNPEPEISHKAPDINGHHGAKKSEHSQNTSCADMFCTSLDFNTVSNALNYIDPQSYMDIALAHSLKSKHTTVLLHPPTA